MQKNLVQYRQQTCMVGSMELTPTTIAAIVLAYQQIADGWQYASNPKQFDKSVILIGRLYAEIMQEDVAQTIDEMTHGDIKLAVIENGVDECGLDY